ncbi:hypothetical protein N0V90_005118 [Kalmusia sp. IMI 367209]|nr:hypothetical protein N0V90_005118 [Kalmusia sp. IMI 367209]
MADDYEELACFTWQELGFEGVDRFAEHLHDPLVGFVGKHRPFKKGKQNGAPPPDQQKREPPQHQEGPPQREPPRQRDLPVQQELPPHPQWELPPPPRGPPPPGLPQQRGYPPRPPAQRQRSYSEPRGDPYDSRSVADDRYGSDSGYENERQRKNTSSSYAPDRRRDGDWRDDGRRDNNGRYDGRRDDRGYERVVEDREYYGPAGTAQQMMARTRNSNNYQGPLFPRVPSPPSDYEHAPRAYGDAWAVHGRPMPQRQRSSSWSSPRRSERRHDSPPRRMRSKSPNHHRAVAVIVGALVGGVAGSRVKKGDGVHNTIATVGGAVVGSIASREIEKMYDRHQDKRAHAAYERGEAKEKRRLEREYNYD